MMDHMAPYGNLDMGSIHGMQHVQLQANEINCTQNVYEKKRVPRGVEEQHVQIIGRSASVAARSSNTKYRCLYCGFEFVGGPQKIRVHLSGKPENGTRLKKCLCAPYEVQRLMESRMRLKDSSDNNQPNPLATVLAIPPRSEEESHTIILERSNSAVAKSSNTKYQCKYCCATFVGGPQKIRVHLTGIPENSTRLKKCKRVPDEVISKMESRRKIRRVEEAGHSEVDLVLLDPLNKLDASTLI